MKDLFFVKNAIKLTKKGVFLASFLHKLGA